MVHSNMRTSWLMALFFTSYFHPMETLIPFSTGTSRLCLRTHFSIEEHYIKKQRPLNFPSHTFRELIWSWQLVELNSQDLHLLFSAPIPIPVPPAYLSTCIIALVTLEALLILVRLLMLYEGIPLMEYCVAIATLLALLDVGMLLSQVDTWEQTNRRL